MSEPRNKRLILPAVDAVVHRYRVEPEDRVSAKSLGRLRFPATELRFELEAGRLNPPAALSKWPEPLPLLQFHRSRSALAKAGHGLFFYCDAVRLVAHCRIGPQHLHAVKLRTSQDLLYGDDLITIERDARGRTIECRFRAGATPGHQLSDAPLILICWLWEALGVENPWISMREV